MNFDDVSKLRNAYELLKNINIKTLVIYSKTSVEINEISLDNDNCIYISSNEITKNVSNIDKYIKKYKNVKEVITIGAGTATDIGKYIAYKLNIKITSIITMLSTNVYATDKVALIVNGRKETLLAKMPDLIIVDETIMKRAIKYNLYGLADVFSIWTALKDWDIAFEDGKDVIDEKIYSKSKRLLNKTIKFVLNSSYEDICNKQEEIFYLIGEAGYITNLYGTGRPESGSEHLFAKEIEGLMDMPHAIAVANGIILMSLIQKNYNKKILECLNKLNLYEESYKLGVNFELINTALNNVKVRKDRYTVMNRVIDDNDYKQEQMEKFKKLVGDYYNVNSK